MKRKNLKLLKTINQKAEKAIKVAVRKTILDHKRTGDPIAVWKNGKVVWIPAKKL